MADYIVEAEDLHKIYSTGSTRVHALRGVSLKIRRGEILSVMGPSGCGKTTLLNCLSGLDGIDKGIVKIDGKRIDNLTDVELTDYRARKMGFVFQAYNLIPVLTAVENVELPMLVGGKKPEVARKMALRAMRDVGLEQWAEHLPNQLSGGQQQRVAIARALGNNPAIVWADEPTGNLDSQSTKEIVNLLVKLNREKGHTFVLVTHDLFVGEHAHRVVQMQDGKIIREYVPSRHGENQ
ncbi:MAG: ABC transporter ATP-binding protein [Thermoplasmata archaeon]|nr:ABC transporter ATP-binding protein [Thermoplasmata archaeon]